jgi:hypothetical protein
VERVCLSFFVAPRYLAGRAARAVLPNRPHTRSTHHPTPTIVATRFVVVVVVAVVVGASSASWPAAAATPSP